MLSARIAGSRELASKAYLANLVSGRTARFRGVCGTFYLFFELWLGLTIGTQTGPKTRNRRLSRS